MNCAKCRQCKAQGNDSWCQGCTALEALNTELHARWSIPALRCVANDIVVSAIRAVSALRTIAGSIESAGASRAATRSAEQPQASGVDRRHSGDTHRERSRAPLPRVKSPPPSTDGESEEEEESEEDSPLVTGAAGKSDPARRPPEPPKPPEPPHPPREYRSGHREEDQHRQDHLDDRCELPRRRESGKKRKGRGSRGGTKHARKYRLLDNPELVIHQRPPRSHWQSDRSFAG